MFVDWSTLLHTAFHSSRAVDDNQEENLLLLFNLIPSITRRLINWTRKVRINSPLNSGHFANSLSDNSRLSLSLWYRRKKPTCESHSHAHGSRALAGCDRIFGIFRTIFYVCRLCKIVEYMCCYRALLAKVRFLDFIC